MPLSGGPANLSKMHSFTASHTESKSTPLAVENSQTAVTTVLKILSLASGKVLYPSWKKSRKADCVVFKTRRFVRPPFILGDSEN